MENLNHDELAPKFLAAGLRFVISKHCPHLGMNGWAGAKLYDGDQEALFGEKSLESIDAAMGFLKPVERVKMSHNNFHDSFKHLIERATGIYTSKGTIIGACLIRGIEVRPNYSGNPLHPLEVDIALCPESLKRRAEEFTRRDK